MCKKICEHTLFNVLIYRMHKRSFDRFALRNAAFNNTYLNNNSKQTNLFEWIKLQSSYIDKHGIDNWLRHSDDATGIPKHLTMHSSPFTYTLQFRNNIFFH
jgi:hypothetical protein